MNTLTLMLEVGILPAGRIIHCRPYYQPTSLRSKQACSNRDRGIARLKVLHEKGKDMTVCNFKTDFRGPISRQFYRGMTGIVTLSWFSRKIFMTVLCELRKTGMSFMDDLRGIFCCNYTTRKVLGQLWPQLLRELSWSFLAKHCQLALAY